MIIKAKEMTVKQMALLSVLVALGIVLNWLENLFFPWTVLPVPGAKLGLANAIFIVVLIIAGFGWSLTLSVLRVLILAVLTGTIATVMFPLSLGGALLSLGLMQFVRWLAGDKISLIGLSVVGAVGHNLGQITVLSLIPGLFPGWSAMWLILPGLLLLAIPAGMITGWIAGQIYPALSKEWGIL